MVSAIVPAYNAGKYITKCLSTLADALDKRDEIIVCAEDSDDDTKETVLTFAEGKENIRLIDVDGKGPSVARNRGIEEAKGDYILFSDADDYVYSDTLKNLLRNGEQLNHHDVLITDICRCYPNGSARVFDQIGHRSLSGIKSLPRILEKRGCFWNIQRCVYRRSFLDNNNIRFSGVDRGEDIDFFTRVLLAKPEIIFVDSPFYCYRMDNTGSIMTVPSLPRLTETVEVLERCIEDLEDDGADWAKAAADGLRCEYIRVMAHGWEIERRDGIGKAAGLFDDYRRVLAGSNDRAVDCAHVMIRTIGLRPFMALMGIARRAKRMVERRNY